MSILQPESKNKHDTIWCSFPDVILKKLQAIQVANNFIKIGLYISIFLQIFLHFNTTNKNNIYKLTNHQTSHAQPSNNYKHIPGAHENSKNPNPNIA